MLSYTCRTYLVYWRWLRVLMLLSLLLIATSFALQAQTSQTFTSTTGFSFTDSPSNSGAIHVPGAYPLTLSVPSISGAITGVSIELDGLQSNGSSGAGSPGLNDFAFLLVAPNGRNLDILSNTCAAVNTTVTISATGTSLPQSKSCTLGSGPYVPQNAFVDTWSGITAGGNPITTINQAPPTGSTLNTIGNIFSFDGSAAAGTWQLYVSNQVGGDCALGCPSLQMTGWKLTIIYNATTIGTSTALTTNLNPSYISGTNSLVTVTANVTATGNTVNGGTVQFFDNGTALVCSGGDQTVTNGQATCQYTFTQQGSHALTASYGGFNGSTTFGSSSSATYTQNVLAHTTNPSGNQFCNPGSTAIQAFPAQSAPYLSNPYPSSLIVSGVPGSINSVGVNINGLHYTSSQRLFELGFLLIGPNGHAFEFWNFAGGTPNGSSLNLTFADNNPVLSENGSVSSGTYGPVAYQAATFPSVSGPVGLPAPAGGQSPATFQSEFGGSTPNGTWQLYSINSNGLGSGSFDSWCVSFSISSGTPTTTTVTSSKQVARTTDTVTISATVTPNPGSGTVEFSNGSTILQAAAPVDTNGVATYTVNSSTLGEGTHVITAAFSGTSTFVSSSGNTLQRLDNNSAETATPPTFVYCNPGAITFAGPPSGGTSTPYPSNIFVSNLPGTINSVSVSLKQWTASPGSNFLNNLLVGPAGNLLFFSGVGGNSNQSGLNLLFGDSASSGLSNDINNVLAAGSYKPSSSGTISFPACPSDVPGCGTVGPPAPINGYNYASPQGVSTFATAFGGGSSSTVNGNGIWSLYSQDAFEETGAIGGGWCLNFNQNLPTLTLTQNGPTTVVQGQSGYSYTFDLKNNGPGPTGGPITLTDLPSSGLTITNIASPDTNWSCSGTSCTYNASIAQDGSAGTLTATISVASNATSPQSNQASVTGGGSASAVNANSISITIQGPTVITAANATATYNSSAQNVTLSATVTSTAGTVNTGTVSFTVIQPGVGNLGTPVTSGTVTNGAANAVFSVPAGTGTGTYSIIATYNAGSGFAGSSDSSHSLTIQGASTTTTAASASVNFSAASQNVPLSATVTSAAGTVNAGTVTFTVFQGVTVIGSPVTSGTVTNGSVSAVFVLPAGATAGTYSIQAVYNPGTNFLGSSDSSHVLTVNSVNIQVTIQTSPPNLLISLDGSPATAAPLVESLPMGSNHTITTTSPQGGSGTQYLFTNWSDGGAISHSITVPASATVYTATFITQYQLTVNVVPAGSGMVTPSSGGFYAPGAVVSLGATPNSGYSFSNWTGNVVNSSSANTSITMNAPETVAANFTPQATALFGNITAKAGASNARIWTVQVGNNGPGAANGAAISSFVLTQTGGAACTPVVINATPIVVGNLAPSTSANALVTIDFSSCAANAKFTANVTLSANSGAARGSVLRYNQYQ